MFSNFLVTKQVKFLPDILVREPRHLDLACHGRLDDVSPDLVLVVLLSFQHESLQNALVGGVVAGLLLYDLLRSISSVRSHSWLQPATGRLFPRQLQAWDRLYTGRLETLIGQTSQH